MQYAMGIAAFLTFAVALSIMYFILRKYTYPAVEEPFFSDPMLFKLFAIGLVEGTVLFVVYTYLSWGNMLVAILFGVILEIVKMVTLNLKKFHGLSDSIFYGFGLGLGIGTAMAFGMAYFLTAKIDVDALSWVIVIVLVLQQIFLNAGTGTIIGEGIARYKPWEFFVKALLINVAYQLLMVPTYLSLYGSSFDYYASYVTMGIALILAITCFYRTTCVNLPGVVRDVLKMQGKKRDDIPE